LNRTGWTLFNANHPDIWTVLHANSQLNRRSQRRSLNWEQYALFIKANPLPKVTICHALF